MMMLDVALMMMLVKVFHVMTVMVVVVAVELWLSAVKSVVVAVVVAVELWLIAVVDVVERRWLL